MARPLATRDCGHYGHAAALAGGWMRGNRDREGSRWQTLSTATRSAHRVELSKNKLIPPYLAVELKYYGLGMKTGDAPTSVQHEDQYRQ